MEDADYRLLSFRWYQGVNLEETVNEGIGVKKDGVIVCMGKLNILWCDPKKKAVLKGLMRRSAREDWVLMNANEIERNQVLDMSASGERWEGDVLDDQPCGWGVLYDKGNNREYEGFRVGDVNVCYGTRYYSDLGVIEYEGEWCEGKRWGRGVQFDRKGGLQYEGEWTNDAHVERKMEIKANNAVLHSSLEELIVSDKCCNNWLLPVFDLSLFFNLREVKVGDKCFRHVGEVRMAGLKRLERVTIGESCFISRDQVGLDPNRRFLVKDCPLMRELRMGRYSFRDYSVCEIEDLPSLEVIEMGDLHEESDNFRLTPKLELKGALDTNANEE